MGIFYSMHMQETEKSATWDHGNFDTDSLESSFFIHLSKHNRGVRQIISISFPYHQSSLHMFTTHSSHLAKPLILQHPTRLPQPCSYCDSSFSYRTCIYFSTSTYVFSCLDRYCLNLLLYNLPRTSLSNADGDASASKETAAYLCYEVAYMDATGVQRQKLHSMGTLFAVNCRPSMAAAPGEVEVVGIGHEAWRSSIVAVA